MKALTRASLALSFIAATLGLTGQVLAQNPLTPPAEAFDVPPPTAVQGEGETPWLYEGSNVPVDREWVFGEMANGLRYAVRRNAVPPRQVSIRVRIDAGSLYERDDEQGYAHLLEHLLFRESTHLGQAEAIAAWQRLGATFGADANAETSPTHTAYKLDIPDIGPAKLEESFKLLSGMIKGPVLSDENVAAELPIVLAEKRERGGASLRVSDLTRRTFFAGQRLSTRNPIGIDETLMAADGAKVQAFYDRWYRPENTVIVVAGDADPMVLAGLVEQWFGDWEGTGEPGVAPNFGDPIAPADAPIAAGTDLSVGELAVAVEPDLPRNLTYAVMRPWRKVQDTIVYNEGLLLDALAQSIINRRLEARARGGGSYLYAQVSQDDVSRSTDATFVAFAPLSSDWQAALADVRGVIADAIANPPTQEEIDREAAEFDVAFANSVEQAPVQAGRNLADNIVNAVDIRETVASPQVVLDVFRGMRARMNPEEVHARTRALFEGDVVRSVYVTPSVGEADQARLQLALASEVTVDDTARLAASDISFDSLPAIGVPGTITEQGPLGILDVEKVSFANGVNAILWANDAEPGRVTVKVRFGAGYRAFDEASAVYASLGQSALVASGIGELGQNELDRIATGRKLGFSFDIDDAVFTFTAQTRSSDLADQLYLFAAKLGMPRWDVEPVIRAKAAAELAYSTYATGPGPVLSRDLEFLVTDEDPRFAIPTPDMLNDVTPEGFREVWEPLLAQGPIEVLIFGEFDRAEIVEKLRVTFGSLSERTSIAADVAGRVPAFPATEPAPVILSHRGDADQAAAAIAWPSGAGMARIRESRQLEILVQIFSNRLLDAMREEAGASYAPQAYSDWPSDIQGGGKIIALAQLKPEFVPVFFTKAEAIAADLVTNPPSLDEINRVTEPLSQRVRRASTGNQFWLFNLEGASTDPQRVELLRSLLADFSNTTPEIMQFLAQRYFGEAMPLKLAVIPEGQELAEAPIAQTLPVSASVTTSEPSLGSVTSGR